MNIVEVTEITDEVVAAFQRLIPQLTPSLTPPTPSELAEIVASPNTVLFVALDDEGNHHILGSLTLALYRIPTAIRAWIEDVVVDNSARHQGIGTALIKAAIQRAAEAGATMVDLTSRPWRESANRLYPRLGFVQRETNVYRYEIGRSEADPF
jgi:GNAT superfamily N-acetyltransferase